jgi:hypothetical protein
LINQTIALYDAQKNINIDFDLSGNVPELLLDANSGLTLLAKIRPSCCSIIFCTIAIPSPLPFIAEAMKDTLEDVNYNVILAADAQQAKIIVKKQLTNRPQVITNQADYR